MPDKKKKFFTVPRVLGGFSLLGILATIAVVIASALSLIALSIVWPVALITFGLCLGYAVTVLSSPSDVSSTTEDLPKTPPQPQTVDHEVVDDDLALKIEETPIFVRYQEAFPTLAEVAEAMAKGEEIPYFSDHLPILFETDEVKILSYNILMADGGNGFAEDNQRRGGALGETNVQTIARNKKNVELIEKIAVKHQPDIICLQESLNPTEDKKNGSKIKFPVGFEGEGRDTPVLVELPKDYQFKPVSVEESYNSFSPAFSWTVTLFSDDFLTRYNVELDADGCTWKCTDKTNENKIIKVVNNHILHQDTFGITEAKIKRQLVNSLSDDATTSKVVSFNVGDFNNRVAPVNDNRPQNLTECARGACCTEEKIQGAASGSGCYQATGTKDKVQFTQINGTFINPKTVELMKNIPPLDTNAMSPSQAKEVNKIEPVVCIDDYYQTTKFINDETIFEYEAFLRRSLGMETLANEAPFSKAILTGDKIKSIVILERGEVSPKEEGVMYFQKMAKGSGVEVAVQAKWYNVDKDGKQKESYSWALDARTNELRALLAEKRQIDRESDPDTFFKIISLSRYVFKNTVNQVYKYEEGITNLLFVRSGATINNDRCLMVVLPKNHEKSKAFYDSLRQELKDEKSILFQENNSWFQSKTPFLIDYQIAIPFDKVDVFHAAVAKHFNPSPNENKTNSSSPSPSNQRL